MPCKTNRGILSLGQVDFSLDLLISLKVNKLNSSEDPFFSFQITFPALCVEMLATPTLRLFSVCSNMRVYIAQQQFTAFTENVEKAIL